MGRGESSSRSALAAPWSFTRMAFIVDMTSSSFARVHARGVRWGSRRPVRHRDGSPRCKPRTTPPLDGGTSVARRSASGWSARGARGCSGAVIVVQRLSRSPAGGSLLTGRANCPDRCGPLSCDAGPSSVCGAHSAGIGVATPARRTRHSERSARTPTEKRDGGPGHDPNLFDQGARAGSLRARRGTPR